MLNLVSASKYKDETISIIMDFADMLQPGEVVSTCAFYISVVTGIDSNPTNILYQTYVPTGTRVDQKFRLGVPGVIYEIVFQVLGSAGSIVDKTTNLAILPTDGNAIPEFTFIYMTSFLYPYNAQDILATFMAPYKGRDFAYIPEGMNTFLAPSSGSIYGGQKNYNIPPEGLNVAMLPATGSIYGGQITYSNYAPEGLNGFCAPIVGSIYGSSISYNIPSTFEGLNVSMTPASGTIH